jgi:pyruvate dehydrogenase E1 component
MAQCLAGHDGPVVAVSEYVRAVADQVHAFVPDGRSFTALGADGYGRSDTRDHLRNFFEVDRYWLAHAALSALAKEGKVNAKDVSRAIKEYKLDPDKPNPLTV